jgi:large subunit ribosomal protein L9
MKEVSLSIAAKVSATGSIYGSVTTAHVAEELQKKGFNVDRKLIFMKDIKAVGSYVANVKLHKEITIDIPVEVVAEAAAE